jgi:hypothetical protein
VAVLVPLALLVRTFLPAPLPKPEPYTGPLPSATPPKELAVFAVVTGVNHRITIEISYLDHEDSDKRKNAFTVVTTWANSAEEFRQKCELMLESYGLEAQNS